MSFIYTNRVGRKITNSFHINDFLAHRVANSKQTWSVPPSSDKPSIAKHFGLDYQQQAQLRESPEYADAVAAFAKANNHEHDLFDVKGVQSSRPTSAITKADKASIGEKVVIAIEGMLPKDDEGQATTGWVNEHLDGLIEHAKRHNFPVKARPAKPEPKAATGETKATLKQSLQDKEEALAAAHALLDKAGIKMAVPDMPEMEAK